MDALSVWCWNRAGPDGRDVLGVAIHVPPTKSMVPSGSYSAVLAFFRRRRLSPNDPKPLMMAM